MTSLKFVKFKNKDELRKQKIPCVITTLLYEVTFLEKNFFFQTKTRENEEKLPRETSPISQLTSTAQME